MKALQVILIICLLACFNTFDFANFIFCLIGNKEVSEAIKVIIDGIKDKKGVLDIVLGVASHLSALIKVGQECFNQYKSK